MFLRCLFGRWPTRLWMLRRAGTNLVYFAFVNYATLGYGDVTPVEGWRLLGPLTAMNGAMMFGWSTAVMYEVLQKTMMISFDTAAE